MKEFAGRTAVVTGGASGIGRALARRLASAGMNVVVADVDASELDAVVSDIRAAGGVAVSVPTDVSRPEQVHELAARANDAFGDVHVLCNNAGIGGPFGLVSQLRRSDWERVLGVNLWGVINGLEAFLPGMLAHGGEGHIVNTASAHSVKTNPMVAAYGTSKHAIFGLTVALYHEMAIEGGRIGVTAVCPGAVNTNAWKSIYSVVSNGEEGGAQVSNTLSGGLDPGRVAELVEAAMRERQLYVFTHPEWLDEIYVAHAQEIAEQRNPAPILGYGAAHQPAARN